jgi:hypothetical protein
MLIVQNIMKMALKNPLTASPLRRREGSNKQSKKVDMRRVLQTCDGR